MEVERSHKGFDVLTEALDTLEALKQRLGDAFPDKKYEQQRKRLLKAALNDDKAASKVRGGDGTPSAPKKLSWTLINSKWATAMTGRVRLPAWGLK
jgi:hypothetical protein